MKNPLIPESIFEDVLSSVPEKPKVFRKEPYKLIDSEECYKLIKDNKGLKHLYKIKGPIEFIEDDPMLSINIAFYQDYLTRNYMDINLAQYAGDQQKLKDLSQWAQKSGPRVRNWHMLVGIENLYGWRPNDDPITEKVHNWVTNVFTPNYNGSEEEFNNRFRLAVEKVLFWKDGTMENDVSIEDYCSNIGSTGTAGSAYDPGGERLEMDYEGQKVKPYNNKFSKSAALSTKNKVKRILAMDKQKCKVSVKLEFFPKKRLIVSADYNTTLKMRYIDQWIRKWLSGNTNSTLWMNRAQMFEMWKKMCIKRGWNCPVDQSAFDHHVSITMVKIMNEVLTKLIKERCTGKKDDLLEVMDRITFALEGGKIIWTEKGKDKEETFDTEYKNGVLSGWQWTALYDTIANVAEHYMALGMMDELGIKYTEKEFNAQGDDELEIFERARECAAYWACLTSMGFELHPAKNFFSNVHNEYLRKFSEEGLLNGYPARMVNSMLWLYPGTNQDSDKFTRMKNIVGNWDKFAQRCNLKIKQVMNQIYRDCRGAKVSAEELDIYLKGAKCVGGYGLELNTTKELEVESGKWVDIEVDGAGFRNFQVRYGENQARGLKNWILNVTATPHVLKGQELKTENETFIQERTELKPLPFAILSNIRKIKFKRGTQPLNALFELNKEVMDRAFPMFDIETQGMHAPRKWICQYAAGQLKTPAPRVQNLSDEMSGLLWSVYEESLNYAMYIKQTRSGDKFKRLQLYAEQHFPFMVQDMVLPTMIG